MKRLLASLAVLVFSTQLSFAAGPSGGPGPSPPPTGSLGQLNVGKSVNNPGTGTGESLLPSQIVTGASKSYGTADLQLMTVRSNSGSSMTDTLPAANTVGMVNGALVNVNNIDGAAIDTLTAGSGTTIQGVSSVVVGAGRDVWFTYDLANTNWRAISNSNGTLLNYNNLSDLQSASVARTNLGLGSAALQNTTFFLQTANNLSDLANASTARTNLGLGTAAVRADTFFLQVNNNLSDLANASTARTNLGLGTAAVQSIGTSGANVPLLSNSNTTSGNNTHNGTETFADGTTITSSAVTIAKQLITKQVGETGVALSGCNGSTATIDLTAGTAFSCTVSAGSVTFAFSNPTTVASFTLQLTNGGSQTKTWPASVKWAGGVPTFTSSGTDTVVCYTLNTGTAWWCSAVLNYSMLYPANDNWLQDIRHVG